MKILVVGLGSIGTRHFKNLKQLGYYDISTVSCDASKSNAIGSSAHFYTLDEALSHKTYDAVILAIPTAYHLKDLNKVIKAGIQHIYLEKPISHSSEGTDEVLEEIAKRKIRVIVGYDLHFDPGIERVIELLKNKELGKVISFNAFVGQYLPDWRPHEDYRLGMSARREAGGGVMLDLVHEFDYLTWICGQVNRLSCFYTNSNSLEIETEDIADCIFEFKDGLIGQLHLDYQQRELIRFCHFTTANGGIRLDLANRSVSWWLGKEKSSFEYQNFERNDRFIQIMKEFMNFNSTDDRLSSFNDALYSLKLVEAAKASSDESKMIKL